MTEWIDCGHDVSTYRGGFEYGIMPNGDVKYLRLCTQCWHAVIGQITVLLTENTTPIKGGFVHVML